MSRKTSIMSDSLKEEIAKELGVYDAVKKDGGWQNVSSKNCGNIVTKAIEIARGIAINNHSELIVHGTNGRIRAKDSFGNDPFPPKG